MFGVSKKQKLKTLRSTGLVTNKFAVSKRGFIFQVKICHMLKEGYFFLYLFIFILHSRESDLYRYFWTRCPHSLGSCHF